MYNVFLTRAEGIGIWVLLWWQGSLLLQRFGWCWEHGVLVVAALYWLPVIIRGRKYSL